LVFFFGFLCYVLMMPYVTEDVWDEDSAYLEMLANEVRRIIFHHFCYTPPLTDCLMTGCASAR
jgi:hypothetical protein